MLYGVCSLGETYMARLIQFFSSYYLLDLTLNLSYTYAAEAGFSTFVKIHVLTLLYRSYTHAGLRGTIVEKCGHKIIKRKNGK